MPHAPASFENIPRLESVGSELELVATAEGHRLVIHLDRFDTNEPVDGATVEVSGDGFPSATASPLGHGTYEIKAEWIEEPGTKALTFVITTGDTTDLLNGTLEIPAAASTAESASINSTAVFARPETWLLAALAALFGFFVSFAFRPIRPPQEQREQPFQPVDPPRSNVVEVKRRAVQIVVATSLLAVAATAALAGPGHDHGDHGDSSETIVIGSSPRKLADGQVFLPKPSQRLLRIRTMVTKETSTRSGTELVGTVVADPAFEGRVQAPMDGVIELSGSGVSFVGQAVKEGDVLASLAPAMPVYERGALEQMAADVEGKLKIAEARLTRLTGVTAGYIAQREIEDTQAEVESLRAQKRVLQPKPAERLPLRAPVSGIISIANVRAGQVVNARDTLFEIVDPARLWVEAIGAGGLDDYTAIDGAQALDGNGATIKLTYVGQAPALRQHSRPLFFKVDGDGRTLAIGATVKVTLQRGEPVEGIVLPEAAVVRGTNGLPQVWTKTGAERFKPAPVRTVALNSTQVLITSGIAAGDRVVVDGSELINQVR